MPTVAEIVVQECRKKSSAGERARLNAIATQLWDFMRKVTATADHLATVAVQAAETRRRRGNAASPRC